MSILTKAFNVLHKSADEVTWPLSWNEWFGGGLTDSGIGVNADTAMRLSAVYGSRRIIAYTISCLPAHTLAKRVGGDREVRESMPAPPWLTHPNRDQTWPEFIAQAVDSLLGDGNAFIDISDKLRDGSPRSLFVLNPRAVNVGRRQDTNEVIHTIGQRVVEPGTILHIKALTLPGSDRGLSPIEMARQEIGIGQGAQKVQAKFYMNGGTVSAILEFPGDMSEEQVKEHAKTFRDLYAGADNAHKIAAVAGATYKPMGVTQQQAQFLELRQFTVVDIGTRIYGIPPHRLGAMLDKPQFGNSIEQQNMSFVQDAILPWTTLIEAAFNRWVLRPPAYLKLNVNGLLRGDAASRAAFYQVMRQQLGVFNGDDVLAYEDMNPMPDGKGEAYWMPANTYLVGDQGFPILPERQAPPGGAE